MNLHTGLGEAGRAGRGGAARARLTRGCRDAPGRVLWCGHLCVRAGRDLLLLAREVNTRTRPRLRSPKCRPAGCRLVRMPGITQHTVNEIKVGPCAYLPARLGLIVTASVGGSQAMKRVYHNLDSLAFVVQRNLSASQRMQVCVARFWGCVRLRGQRSGGAHYRDCGRSSCASKSRRPPGSPCGTRRSDCCSGEAIRARHGAWLRVRKRCILGRSTFDKKRDAMLDAEELEDMGVVTSQDSPRIVDRRVAALRKGGDE
jgi:hypothetical protein